MKGVNGRGGGGGTEWSSETPERSAALIIIIIWNLRNAFRDSKRFTT